MSPRGRGKPWSAAIIAISNCQVHLDDFPPLASKKLPRMAIPAAPVGKLATDMTARGVGLGALLLMSSLRQIQHLADRVGVTAAIVDAIDDDARRFYLKYGFQELVNHADRLFLMVHVIRKLALPALPTASSSRGR